MYKLTENQETGEIKLLFLKKSKNQQLKSEEIRYKTITYKPIGIKPFEYCSVIAITEDGKSINIDNCEYEAIGKTKYDLTPEDWVTRNMGGKV